MAVLFTPFPIFAPYEHWKPVGSIDLPENLAIRRRLDEVDSACQAHLGILYCSRFLEFSSHRWAPGKAKSQYTELCRSLEQMLNWSFSAGISLLDWDPCNFREFLKFLCFPPTSWCASASHSKYMGSAHKAFREWPLNDRWNLFYRHIENGFAAKPSRRNLCRCAKVAKDFFAFYISENASLERSPTDARPGQRRANCAQNTPSDIINALDVNLPLIDYDAYELDWVFEQILGGAVRVLRSEQILFYMAIARFTRIKISHVQFLSQFQTDSDGGWVFDNGLQPTALLELSPEFSAHLERYLGWYAVDPNEPLPQAPVFPTNDGSFSYSPDVLHKHIGEFAKRLADAAFACADPAIASAASKFRSMTYTTIQRSTRYTWKTYYLEVQTRRRHTYMKRFR